jgi:colanic acid/amylovoran biosynthesis glycosyltransferase
MRIAYLVNQYPKVSHSFIRREILALERRGFEIMRISLRGWNEGLVDDDDKLERERTRYVLRDGVLGLLLSFFRILATRPLRLLRSLGLAWRMGWRAERHLLVHLVYLAEACHIVTWLRASDIQHLHAHFGTNSAEVAMLVHSLGGPQWSFTVHGPKEFEKVKPIRLAEKIQRCAFVVAISSYGRSQLYRLVEHQYWQKIHVVHCGLDATFLTVGPKPMPAARRLVCVSRLCEQKGQPLLIEAAHRLIAQGEDFELVLAGDGELRANIETLIARHKLESKIHITGWISGEQVRQQMLSARALVLPSFAEGLPVAIMEAMALRRPVISTYVAGIPELVRPNEHGWLVPAGDVTALVEAMRACLNASPEFLTYMGQAARECVLARHDIEAAAAKLAALFRDTTRCYPRNSVSSLPSPGCSRTSL